MIISIVAALSENNVIGLKNKLPWHIPEDLKHFKKITLGKPIIMGRNTYVSIGRVLPNRRNMIITRNKKYSVSGATIAHSLDEALNICRKTAASNPEVCIIGGAEIYKHALPLAHRLYLTRVHATYAGDAFFPDGDWEKEFSVVEEVPHEPEGGLSYTFLTLERC